MSEEHTSQEPNQEETAPQEAAANDAPVETEPPSPGRAYPEEPRIPLVWPLAVTAAQLLLMLYFVKTSTMPMRTYLGIGVVPVIGLALILGWWFRITTLPLRTRLVGFAVAGAAALFPALISWRFGYYLLVYTIPSLQVLLCAALALTARARWAERRVVLVCAAIFIGVFFSFTRIPAVDGNYAPKIAWRWSAEPELAPVAAAPGRVAALPETLDPEDWPGFRGARRDGRNMVSRFGVDWATQPPVERWRRPVGLGWSSFAVVGDYLFTQEQRGPEEAVVCYEAATGNEVWANLIPERFEEVTGSGPRATPQFDRGKLYTQGATGILQCIDASTGATVWKRDLKQDANMDTPQWGFSSSPLVAGDLVIAYAGGGGGRSVLAYNRESGEPVWAAGVGTNGYSSPHWAEIALSPQILQMSNHGIEAFDPATGKLLWEDAWDIKRNPRVAQPFVIDFYTLIAGTGQGKGARLLKVEKEGEVFVPKVLWTSEKFRPYFNDYVFHDGYLYGFDGNRFACLEAATGFLRWSGPRYGGQILALNEIDMLLLLTEEGEIILVSAFPSFIEERGRIRAFDSKTWNHPVVSRGRLYVRNDREAVCYDLPPAAEKKEAPKIEGGIDQKAASGAEEE